MTVPAAAGRVPVGAAPPTPGRPGGPSPAQVVCVGEAMAVLTPAHGGPVRDAPALASSVGGSELNVALSLARLGVPTAWLSRLGADGFGDRVLDAARAHGVEVGAVERDAHRPTGLYVKETGTAPDGSPSSRMHYYRAGSAASAMSAAWLAGPEVARQVEGAEVVHVSGITAALSASAAEAVGALAAQVARTPGTRLTVDLNFRPALWRGRSTEALRTLLAGADEVLLGADEALEALGTDDPRRLAALLPGARRVVVKEADHGVTVVEDGEVLARVPGLRAHVVEPVGAGDAFAAGYLAGTCRGLDVVRSVRVGHLCAALVLGTRDDRPPGLPPWEELVALASGDERDWAGTHVRGDVVRTGSPAGGVVAGSRSAGASR